MNTQDYAAALKKLVEAKVSSDFTSSWETMAISLGYQFGTQRPVSACQQHAMFKVAEAMQAVGDGDWEALSECALYLRNFRGWPTNPPKPAPGPRFRMVEKAATATRTGQAAATLRRVASLLEELEANGPVELDLTVRVPVEDASAAQKPHRGDYAIEQDYPEEALLIHADGTYRCEGTTLWEDE